MSLVTRYFSTSSAGAADGTTWADRAALFSAGNWSTVITGFNFSGTDSLLGLLGPGTYTCSQSLASGLFTNAPTVANPLILHGCDSSGNVLAVPNPSWVSAMAAWDSSGLPLIQTTTNISTVNLANCTARLLAFSASGNTTNAVIGSAVATVDWCSVVSSSSNTSAASVATIATLTNSVATMSGTSYASASGATDMLNCRLGGNASATSGNRHGWTSATAAPTIRGCTIFNHVGSAIISTAASAAFSVTAIHNTLINCGANGILLTATASQTAVCRLLNNYIANCGTWGIDASASRALAANNRLRDNTGGNLTNFANYPTNLGNYTTDSDDATEFVDAAGGDYRIKSGSAIAGQGFGVSDQPASGGTSARARIVNGE
jgi:hypothetical protein